MDASVEVQRGTRYQSPGQLGRGPKLAGFGVRANSPEMGFNPTVSKEFRGPRVISRA